MKNYVDEVHYSKAARNFIKSRTKKEKDSDEDVSLVNAFVKKLILAWDPDFTKVTSDEKKILEEADEEMRNGVFYSEEDVWE